MDIKEIEGQARLRHLQACVFPILAEQGDSAGVHGSALLFRREDHHYAVTATHVAKYLETHAEVMSAPSASHVGLTDAWSLGRGTLAKTAEEEEDVSVFRLEEAGVVERLRAGGHVFLCNDDVEPLPQASSTCGVFGWPAAGARQVDRVVHGKAVAMLLARLAPPPGSRPTDIFLEWPSVDDVPDLAGISGSPIWAVSEASGVWHPSKEIKLVGVQHSIRRSDWIRGTSWSVVNKLIDRVSGR